MLDQPVNRGRYALDDAPVNVQNATGSLFDDLDDGDIVPSMDDLVDQSAAVVTERRAERLRHRR